MKIIIDGNNLAHIAKGNALLDDFNCNNPEVIDSFYYIFLFKLNKYLGMTKNKNDVWLVWDHPRGSSYRKSIYPTYKAQRKKTISGDVLWKTLMPNIKNIIEMYPINQIESEFGEGDDIIYSLCRIFSDEEKFVCSADGDLKQLLLYHNNIKLYNPRKKDYENIPDKDFVKLKAIIGDSGDHVGGVFRVGEKNAPAYLNGEKKFTTIQQEQYDLALKLVDLTIYEHTDKIEEQIKEYIKNKKFAFNPDEIELYLMENNINQVYQGWTKMKEYLL